MNTMNNLIKLVLIVSFAVSMAGCAKAESEKYTLTKMIFESPEPLLVIEVDNKENVYAITTKGTILKVLPDGKSQELATGLDTYGFSAQVLAVYDEGYLLVNNCVNEKNVLLKIDHAGNRTELLTSDDSLRSIAVGISGKIYLGFWKSKGDISLNFQPFQYLGTDPTPEKWKIG